jgi:hypothetical protein
MTRSPGPVALALAAVFAAAGCQGPNGAGAAGREDMLAAAGFVPKPANDPARMAALRALPPHQFVVRNTGGVTKVLYADPTSCACIYVGDQAAYDRYRQVMATRQTATDNQVRAVLSSAPLPGENGL